MLSSSASLYCRTALGPMAALRPALTGSLRYCSTASKCLQTVNINRKAWTGTVPLTVLPGTLKEASYNILYKCHECDTHGAWQVSKHVFHNGLIAVRCPGCNQLHLISDTLGCFSGIPQSDEARFQEKLMDLIKNSAQFYSEISVEDKDLPCVQVEGLDEESSRKLQLRLVNEIHK
mmetsp:Transcript_3407/g.3960  ORF Transcript_3407/g.3960 Transcript_3407/m.3960 type:complete len:176 (+) Transcript_3407:310-837(+)